MAKIRVYELAKELKVDSKEMVRQLIEMGFDVRNHMSVITEEEAQQVRDRNVESRSEVIEEKRITKRVIRRRRKKVEPGPEEAEAETEAGEEAPAVEAEEAAEEAQEAEAAETAPAAEAEPEPKAEEAAPSAEAEEAAEEAPEASEAEAAEVPPVAVAEAEAEPEAAAPVAEEAQAPAEPEADAAEPPAKAAAEPEAPAKAKKPAPVKKPAKKPDAKPKAKRRKGDEPARIISRPTKPVAPITRPPGPSSPPRPRPGQEPPAAGIPPADKGDDRSRSRRKKGKKSASIPDDEYLMRKTASRRREILDKADLYSGKPSRGRRRGPSTGKKAQKTAITTPKAIKRRIKVGEGITVGDLAKRMGVKAAEMVGRLMQMGMMVTLNQSLDVDDAGLVAAEFGFEVEKKGFEEEGLLDTVQDKPEDMKPRPAVVTIMGHVDHGKTSLLDSIRTSNVTGDEAGGITQHIGAYDVHLEGGGHVVFVDTPGHEAFTQMRSRGAQVTDVVVLVVAADDGVMEQTKEAVNHARAAKVPIVVAVNKIDKPGAEPDKVRRGLSELELVPEDWGGDTIMVDVSAKTGEGIDTLLEMLELQSEILELQANPDRPASGRILEASLDKGRGPVATVLVQQGTLRAGDAVICGVHAGKIRAMFDDHGRRVEEAGPSIPVEIQGLTGVPEAGDDFAAVENDRAAKQIAEHRALKKREAELGAQTKISLESVLDKIQEDQVQELNLVVKADVQGSVEALVDALSKLGNEKVKVSVIHSATGAITETDVMLAAASSAIIIGFNVRPTGKVSEVAEAERVEIRTYEVIYEVIEEVTKALTGMLAPRLEEDVIGHVEVRDTFKVPKMGMVAGSYVTDGKVERGALARLLRDGVVVASTRIQSLRRFKEDVKEVAQGFECGIGLENYNDIKVGDTIEVYRTREVAAQL